MTIEETLAERGARYGDFTDHAKLSQMLVDAMRFHGIKWDRMSSDKRQALTVIADKIARILTGDPEYRDNWHDIQGYAKLAEDRCKDQREEFAGRVRVGDTTLVFGQDRVNPIFAGRPADPLAGVRIATENALEAARENPLAPTSVRLALTRALQEIDNQKKDD